MDYDLLMRVAKYPIETNFTLRRHTPVVSPIDVGKHLEPFRRAARLWLTAPAATGSLNQRRRRGQWRCWCGGCVLGVEPGLGETATAGYHLQQRDLRGLSLTN